MNKGRQFRSPYESAYRSYRRLVRHLLDRDSPLFVAVSLADGTLRTRDVQQLRLQARYHTVERAFEDAKPLWRELHEIRESIVGGRHDDDPLPDVYAAALSMRIGGDWNLERDRSIYRGQRCSRWEVVPSLFRPESDGSAADVKARWRRTSAFATLVHSRHPELSDEQCLAVAQHYSAKDEAGTPTHLIDVTWEPLVALFFASLNGIKDDLGLVDHIVISEWQRLVAGERGDPGAIRVIEVPAVQRILKQRALFLVTPDPDLYERYVPYRIWFQQVEGVVFEDPDMDPPITRADMFPVDESIRTLIEEFRRDEGAGEGAPSSSLPSPSVLDAESLRQRALAMDPRLADLNSYHDTVLQVVCELLAQGSQWARDCNPSKYSMHRLDECVQLLAEAEDSGRRCGVEDALQFMLSRLDEDESNGLIALAHSKWAQLHPVPVGVVAAELVRLVEDVGPLPKKLAGMAFSGGEAHAREVFATLGEEPQWTLVDARRAANPEIAHSLATAPQPRTLLVAVDNLDPLPTPVRRLAKALLDCRGHADLMPENRLDLHPNSIWVLVCGGSRGFQQRREALVLVPYWVDVDEFR